MKTGTDELLQMQYHQVGDAWQVLFGKPEVAFIWVDCIHPLPILLIVSVTIIVRKLEHEDEDLVVGLT
jgi:hypothetical protein